MMNLKITCLTLLTACAVVSGYIGLDKFDDSYIRGASSMFYYPGLKNHQYAVGVLNSGGDSSKNPLHPCYKEPGSKYLNKERWYTMVAPIRWQNFWARERIKGDVKIHAEIQVLDALPEVMRQFGDTVKEIHMYTQLSPCERCTDRIRDFARDHRTVKFYIGYDYVFTHEEDPTGEIALNYAKTEFRPMKNLWFDQVADPTRGPGMSCSYVTGRNENTLF